MHPSDLDDALAVSDGWAVPNTALAVVGPDGVLASRGDTSRVFDLASVTKLMSAYACLVAVEEGTLVLDEPAGPPGATVRHLLAHTAGLGFDSGVLMPPGRKRIYSNTGFEALAEHLAERAGIDPPSYVSEAVLTPLGLSDSAIGGSLAHGASSTVADLALFANELLRPTLISSATMHEAVTVQFPGLKGVLPGFGTRGVNDWGLGFEIRGHKAPHWTGATNSPATFGHFGAAGTFLWVDPSLDVALICLNDRAFGRWASEAWPSLADAVVTAVGRPQ